MALLQRGAASCRRLGRGCRWIILCCRLLCCRHLGRDRLGSDRVRRLPHADTAPMCPRHHQQRRPRTDAALVERVVALERLALAHEVKRGWARPVPIFILNLLLDDALGSVHCAVHRHLAFSLAVVRYEMQFYQRASALSQSVLRVLSGLESLGRGGPTADPEAPKRSDADLYNQ